MFLKQKWKYRKTKVKYSLSEYTFSYIYFIKLNEFPVSVPVPNFPVYDFSHLSPAALNASHFLFILNSAIYLWSHTVVSA